MEMEAGPDTIREGEDDVQMPTETGRRKRSAKGASATKAPMDGGMYGKKPMDGEACSCGKRKAKCDGNCGKKMDTAPSLFAPGFAFDMDNLRVDLSCGNGAISQGEKCTKGPATRVEPKRASSSGRPSKATSGKSKPQPSLTRSALKAAKGFAEFVGPDLAAEVLLTGGAFLLGKGLLGRPRQSYRYRQASRGARRAINRARFGRPNRRYQRYGPRRDSLIQHYTSTQLQPPTRLDAAVFTNEKLHAAVKAEAKRKFKVYPSAYANAWMVKEYKRRGGKFRGDALDTWFKEKWVRMNSAGRILGPCGDRTEGEGKPKCLPAAKAQKLPAAQRRKLVARKRRNDPQKERTGAPVMVSSKTDIWATGFDAEDGKKYTKVVTNPETGRKKRIRYGAKGYRIAPGTTKGNSYCARSFGDMKSHGKDCSGPDRDTPLCLSRAKWKCSGKTSRQDGLTPGKF